MKNSDELIRKLMKKHGPVEPAADFTKQVMQKIEYERFGGQASTVSDLKTWMYLAAVVAISIMAIVYLYYQGIFSGIEGSFGPVLLPVIKEFTVSFKNLFGSFQVSKVTLIILFAIFSIFLLDRILNITRIRKNSYVIL